MISETIFEKDHFLLGASGSIVQKWFYLFSALILWGRLFTKEDTEAEKVPSTKTHVLITVSNLQHLKATLETPKTLKKLAGDMGILTFSDDREESKKRKLKMQFPFTWLTTSYVAQTRACWGLWAPLSTTASLLTPHLSACELQPALWATVKVT